MVTLIQSLIVVIESFVIFSLFKKFKPFDPILIFGCLIFFYSNSLFFDYILFGIDHIYLESFGYIYYFDSKQNLFLSIYALLFIISTKYFSNNIFGLKNQSSNSINISRNFSLFDVLTLSISIGILSFYIVLNFKNYRYNLMGIENHFEFIVINILVYLIIFLTIHKNFHLISKLFLIFFIFLYGFITYQRELIVFSFYMIIIIFNFKYNLKFYLFIFFALLTVGFSKFYTNVFKSFFQPEVINTTVNSFSFTKIDPASSYYLFDSVVNDTHLHSNYLMSIFSQPYYQIIRVFTGIKNLSPAEFTTEFLTHNYMGTAYSVFAESYLNFGVAGAIIFPFLFINIFFVFKKYFLSCYGIYLFIWFVFFIKIIRTDFTTTIKIYIIPILFSFLIILFFNYLNKNVFKKHHSS